MLILANMGGVAPKITAEMLPETAAQVASNARLHKGGVAPLRAPADMVPAVTPTKGGAANSIYRFGKYAGERQYWFKWPGLVSVCRGPVADAAEERTYYTGDGWPKRTNMTLALQSGTDYPMAWSHLGVPSPAVIDTVNKGKPTLALVAGTGPVVAETRAYVYTHVSDWGEESAPSGATIITVDSTHAVQLSGFCGMPSSGSYNLQYRNIYRSVTSSSGTNYYWVGQIPIATSSWTDTTTATGIGEPLPTLDWDLPPNDLTGLVALPSGALCGFSGKQVCFSVIGAPYAWPQKYYKTADYNIVAVAPMGQGVVVLTDGFPYFINTGDPESAQMIRLDEEQACVAMRSVVAFAGGVIYASPDGLCSVTSSGVTLVTDALYDHETWQAINPAGIFAVKHDGRYYGFLPSGGFIFDPKQGITFHDITVTAAYVDPVLDQMYVAIGGNIQKWDSGSAKVSVWKSKRWNLPKPINFPYAQVKANSFNNMTFKLYADGALIYSTAVTSGNGFRLPSGFETQIYEIEIDSADHWTNCAVGTLDELKNV